MALRSVYASGKEIVVHSGSGRYIQSIAHAEFTDAISRIACNPFGGILAVAGSHVATFDLTFSETDQRNSKGVKLTAQPQWTYTSAFELGDADADVSACAWLDSRLVVIGTGSTLLLWSFAESQWTQPRVQTTGGGIDKIATVFGAGIFATSSYDSRLVKVWQLTGDGDDSNELRFQYVVHPVAVHDLFWRQRPSSSDHAESGTLSMCAVTRDGRLYVWHSVKTDDVARPSKSPYGINFSLAMTVDLARAPTFGGSDDCVHRELVAANIITRPFQNSTLAVKTTDSAAAEGVSNENSLSDPSMSQPVVAREGGNAHPSDGDDSSAKVDQPAVSPKRYQAPSDLIYAAYSDGSMSMWEVSLSSDAFTALKPRIVLQTPARETTTFLMPPPQALGARPASSLMWELSAKTLLLALVDAVGHVFILSTPSQPATNGSDQRALEVHDLWDGHKEPIFHISVDPYSQRVATHSTEGELLIWDSVAADGKEISVSRRMALDGSQIRTIAWAPTESEFIAATNDKVYRMQYSTATLQWLPGDSYMPQLSAFDRIFTIPADPVDELAGPNSNRPYFISTFEGDSGCIRTWRVPGPSDCIEYIGSSTLSQSGGFDKASRVMPVSHPFFSRDNIMATFDASSGGLSIWGIRTEPEFVWFCSKKHRLPCMNVDMIRYNSIDKAAIVSTEPDGSQTITIWIFSSASRASHYLPAGTIYPRNKTDRVREIRWHLTSYAQTYLGVQWDSCVDIYCQERSLDDTWLCVMTIPAAEFGKDKKIGSFSFTDAGGPTFSIGRQLIVHSHSLPNDRLLCDVAYEEHGELPLIHPLVLTELMSWGQMDAVKSLLAQLYDYMRELEIDAKRDVALPMVPLHDLISPSGPGLDKASLGSLSRDPPNTSKYSALFSSELDDCTLDSGSASLDFEGFNREKAEYLMERLTEIKVQGISPIDQARLMSIVGTISATQAKDQPIDSMGVRYFNKLQLLELENRRTRSSQELSYRELNWALHSNSQAVLLQLCLQTHAPDGLTWESARRMGLFMWLSDTSVLHAEVEKMARNIFVSQGRDPTKCAIFYLALRKQRLLHGLWRTAGSHPEHGKMVAFLANDFSESRWKTAAAKNAYVLLSRQRYLDAATFFMLSGKLADAATICVTQLNDIQLAVTLCRCYEGDNGPVLKDLLWKHILPEAFKRQSRWLASLVFGIIHRYDLVLQSLTDDLANLAAEIGVEAKASSYSRMDPLDTELLILYRSMLTHSPKYRAPLVTQAELIAQTITIFECLGAPIMSLVVLEWWRRELYTITKTHVSVSIAPSTRFASSQSSSGADPMDSGILDMSLFGAFTGFGNTGAKPVRSENPARPAAPAAVDPMDSGMLSMDSFGSMFSGMPKRADATSSRSQETPAVAMSKPQEQQQATPLEKGDDPATNGIDDVALAVDIEDTPVQYACRTMLALQIMEFICRAKNASKASTIDVDREKQTIADTLRLPLSIFPR
ncbi:regulator of (H+)-ATPase in vacuolar membrane [Coemansia pectinata]|uniref:Regulator of (H+)-ATPase in vacuolar membrane n=1 Tax=Coemansia pectinata TaxID=1052879 RepID=A0A9W8GYX8_9FUNG|nr:regulator of (H+)-ATPase in vacuolar membrane [Coemansia pectinata]